MTHHFSRNTVSASFYCGKCGKVTQHRIDADSGQGRKGPCLDCIDRLEKQHQARKDPEPQKQTKLFE